MEPTDFVAKHGTKVGKRVYSRVPFFVVFISPDLQSPSFLRLKFFRRFFTLSPVLHSSRRRRRFSSVIRLFCIIFFSPRCRSVAPKISAPHALTPSLPFAFSSAAGENVILRFHLRKCDDLLERTVSCAANSLSWSLCSRSFRRSLVNARR